MAPPGPDAAEPADGSRPADPTAEPAKVARQFSQFGAFVAEFSSCLSLSGMFMATPDPLPVGQHLVFDLRLDDGFRLVQGRGEVVWVRPHDTGADLPAGMGIRFEAIDGKGRDLVLKLLEDQVKSGGSTFELEPLPPGAIRDFKGTAPGARLDTGTRRAVSAAEAVAASPSPAVAVPVAAAPADVESAATEAVTAASSTSSVTGVEAALEDAIDGHATVDASSLATDPALEAPSLAAEPSLDVPSLDPPWGEQLPEIPDEFLEQQPQALEVDDVVQLAAAAEDVAEVELPSLEADEDVPTSASLFDVLPADAHAADAPIAADLPGGGDGAPSIDDDHDPFPELSTESAEEGLPDLDLPAVEAPADLFEQGATDEPDTAGAPTLSPGFAVTPPSVEVQPPVEVDAAPAPVDVHPLPEVDTEGAEELADLAGLAGQEVEAPVVARLPDPTPPAAFAGLDPSAGSAESPPAVMGLDSLPAPTPPSSVGLGSGTTDIEPAPTDTVPTSLDQDDLARAGAQADVPRWVPEDVSMVEEPVPAARSGGGKLLPIVALVAMVGLGAAYVYRQPLLDAVGLGGADSTESFATMDAVTPPGPSRGGQVSEDAGPLPVQDTGSGAVRGDGASEDPAPLPVEDAETDLARGDVVPEGSPSVEEETPGAQVDGDVPSTAPVASSDRSSPPGRPREAEPLAASPLRAVPSASRRGAAPVEDRTAYSRVSTPAGARVTDIAWRDTGAGTRVSVRTDGAFDPARVDLLRMPGPPRLVVRIAGIDEAYRAVRIAVGSASVSRLRIGHHPDQRSLHVVIDLASEAVELVSPEVEPGADGEGFHLTLRQR